PQGRGAGIVPVTPLSAPGRLGQVPVPLAVCEPAPPATASSKFSGVTQNRAVTKSKAVTKISGVTKKRGRPRIEQPLTGAKLRALRRLQREQEPGRYVFISERGAPITPDGFKKLIS